MTVYGRIDCVPEMMEGQIARVEINKHIVAITFQERKQLGCNGCVFQKAQYDYCRNAKCVPINRKDNKIGIFVKIEEDGGDIDITPEGWDFVCNNITPLADPYHDHLSHYKERLDAGQILNKDELLEYYRGLAMVYIDAVNNFTKTK